MQRRRIVALGAVIALVAAGWWWLRDRGTAKPAAIAATAPSAPGAPARERAQRGGELAQRTAIIVVEDDPRGALRLEGQVIDAEDHGVAGATVTITSNPPRTTTSEADGSFAFDALVGRPYTLVARVAQGVAGPVTA
ncbi:MAG TPA: carboxypeptidase regulatory-like domain-containing protein, partial [Kofleriaceae bacterium]|nr:carboxypeptidase regulatory-like domain-containing protein [Kofleriaceae bacterium]